MPRPRHAHRPGVGMKPRTPEQLEAMRRAAERRRELAAQNDRYLTDLACTRAVRWLGALLAPPVPVGFRRVESVGLVDGQWTYSWARKVQS